MNKKEKRLIFELCKFKKVWFDDSLLEYATPAVLGHLFYNRVQAIAYDRLRKHCHLRNVNREFRNSLQNAYEQNIARNASYLQCVDMISKLLAQCDSLIAMLKGSYLCASYPDGYRTSNDIDLLVSPDDITLVGNILTNAGFRQGKIRNNKFEPAGRIDIIESRVLRGEVVPYIKEVNLPYMKYLEVDINYSLDYKNGNKDIVQAFLQKTKKVTVKGITIPTLEATDFFIHLCVHLYKEATTIPWIEMGRDMTLYKYCDIYYMLSDMSEEDITKVIERSTELGLEKICAYAIIQTMELFDIKNDFLRISAANALNNDLSFLRMVTSPREKRFLRYRVRGTKKRFFIENRLKDLEEVRYDEAT